MTHLLCCLPHAHEIIQPHLPMTDQPSLGILLTTLDWQFIDYWLIEQREVKPALRFITRQFDSAEVPRIILLHSNPRPRDKSNKALSLALGALAEQLDQSCPWSDCYWLWRPNGLWQVNSTLKPQLQLSSRRCSQLPSPAIIRPGSIGTLTLM